MNEIAEKDKVEEKDKNLEQPEEIQVDISDLDLGKPDELEAEPAKKKAEGVEDWNDDSTMPVAAHIHTKNKLKGQIGEANDENERLRQENERLKSTPKPVENKLGPMPKQKDYEDDEKFESDVRKWHTDVANESIMKANVANTQNTTNQNAVNTTKEAVSTHYERADVFVKENEIDEKIYNQADKNIRLAVESVFPGGGDIITDRLIASLGKGSEKALLIVGRNQENLDRLKSLLISDRNGLQAIGYLGSIIGQYKKKAKKQSMAPSPVPDIKTGEKSVVVPESSLKKMWKAADKNGDATKAYNIYSKAKKAGCDVSKWR